MSITTTKCKYLLFFLLFLSHYTLATLNIDQANKEQFIIPTKIYSYLQKHGDDQNFAEKFKVDEDTDHSETISILYLYFKWLETQENPEEKLQEDYKWFNSEIDSRVSWNGKIKSPHHENIKLSNLFQNSINLIINWDGKRDLNNKERIIFETLITLICFFENISEYPPSCQRSLEKILEFAKARKANREYTIASLLTLENFKKLLNTKGIIQNKKLIIINTHVQSTALFKSGEIYNYFAPNNKEKETKTKSLDEIAELVFKANNFDNNKPSPIGIFIFSFDETDERSKSTYPSQQDVLTDIAPTLETQKDYAEGLTGLIMASRIGCLESTKYLLDKGADPNNSQNKFGLTALMVASAAGFPGISEELLDKNADPNIQSFEGASALILAALFKHLNIVKILLRKNADTNLKANGLTALEVALQSEYLEIAKEIFMSATGHYNFSSYGSSQAKILKKISDYLFKNTQDINIIKHIVPINGRCGGLSTIWLLSKANKKNKDWLKLGIDQKVNWEEKLARKYNPYINMSWFNSTKHSIIDLDEENIEKSENIELFISLTSLFQEPKLYIPTYQGNLEKIFGLMGEKSLAKEYSTASLFTLEQLKMLLNTKNFIQENKIILIISHNHITALFKEHGKYYYYDPNEPNGEIQTTSIDKVAELIFDANEFYDSAPSPLTFKIFSFDQSSIHKYPSQHEILTKIAPTLEAQKDYAEEWTGLIMAAKHNCLESARFFLKLGANPNAKNKDGISALQYASTLGYFDIAKEILENGINVDINITQKNSECTSLILAANSGHLSIVKLLLKHGADPTLVDINGKTALIHAKENGYTEIAKEIENQN